MTIDHSPSLTLFTAVVLATNFHAGQKDKAGRDYYTAHLADVAGRLREDGESADVRAVGLLHDILEDTNCTEDYLRIRLPGYVVDAIVALTSPPGERRLDYYARVKANPIALKVKLADVASNADPERLAAIPDAETRERLTRKYAEAKEYLTS